MGTTRRSAVLGSPIAHSRSPQLHLAAYRALGLSEWTYDRIECTEDKLPGVVSGLGPEWVGLSVTMPGKFAALLARHGVERLGVRHVRDHVVGVDTADDGDIAAVRTRASGAIAGDLFIDCTGHAALLIGERYGVPVIDRSGDLPNDRALAVQVPVGPDDPIASTTNATAHAAGWIWDIGLPTRRGVGHVFSSSHISDDAAEQELRAYLGPAGKDLPVRKLAIRAGHRETFWKNNCVAVGLAAGFL